MAVLIGAIAAIFGALVGTLATYLATRSNLWLTLEHSYDQALQSTRLERYQALFHLSRCLPRYWHHGETPTREDLRRFSREFHNWYFGDDAGGMFLSPNAKGLYILMMNKIAESAYSPAAGADNNGAETPLTEAESQQLRDAASELRHQLSADVGTSNPPRIPWTRLSRPIPPPPATVVRGGPPPST